LAGNAFAANRSAQLSSTLLQNSGKVNGKIVFSSNRKFDGRGFRLWTMNPDGSNPIQLTDLPSGPNASSYVYDDYSKWSPDGTEIAFTTIGRSSLDGRSIYVMNADGSNLRQIVIEGSIGGDVGLFEWSPDGTKFLFNAGDSGLGIAGDLTPFDPTENIFIVDVDGKNLAKLTNDTEIANGGATWSPDGNLIAFASNRDGTSKIYIMNADGSNQHTIGVAASGFSWSPDGSTILLVGPGNPENCYNIACQELYTIRPDGSNLTQLTHYSGSYTSPRYSPDGTKILFERHMGMHFETHDFPFAARYYSDEGHALFVMDADGNNQTNISNRDPGNYYYELDPDCQRLTAPANDPLPSVLGVSSDLYMATYPAPPKIYITVNRTGNLNQTVSCDYKVRWEGGTLGGLPQGALSFAPGETSKTIEYSAFSYTSDFYYISLTNNGGNATLAGGIKDAMLVLKSGTFNPIVKTDFFVRQQYEDFLNRDPDELGWQFWNINLSICGTPGAGAACYEARRADVSAAFFLSIEFQETGFEVYRVYKAAFSNLPRMPVPIRFNEFLPDTQKLQQGASVGQSNWQQQLETNKQNFALEFVQRPRFVAAYPAGLMPSNFVDALFTNSGITPSETERHALMAEFPSGNNTADNAARARVLRRVAENAAVAQQEFNRAFVLMEYFGYLRRNPNDAPDSDFSGYDFWLNKLNQFNGDFQKAEMVKAFITSAEYRKRFGQP
jgi:Tol biopolymer transport system component